MKFGEGPARMRGVRSKQRRAAHNSKYGRRVRVRVRLPLFLEIEF